MSQQDLQGMRDEERLASLVMAARIALRRGQMEEAQTRLKEAITVRPTDQAALELLGDLFMEQGEQEKALRVFENGQKLHPRHRAFEEKAALAYLDLEEMKRDRERQANLIEAGDPDRLLDKRPGAAFGLSLIVPGAGQYYNDQGERAAVFFGAALLLFGAWFFPLTGAIKRVTAQSARPAGDALTQALSSFEGAGRLLLFLMIAGWLLTHVWAALDALTGAERANFARRRGLGIEV